jgi:hypothetical protein
MLRLNRNISGGQLTIGYHFGKPLGYMSLGCYGIGRNNINVSHSGCFGGSM